MTLGPVSTALHADLATMVRRKGVLVWLDLDGHYTAFVDALAQRPPDDSSHTILGLRGSYLELLLALEPHTHTIDPPRLVVHAPGLNEQSIATTPLFELYAAGTRYRKALPTLVEEAAAGRVPPDAIASFLASGDLTLEAADAWLTAQLDDTGSTDAQALRVMTPRAVLDDLLRGTTRITDRQALWDQFTVWTGIPEAWRAFVGGDDLPAPDDLATAVISWVLSVEYVDDLRRPPIDPKLAGIPALPRALIDTCGELAAWLRDTHPDAYERTADDTETWLEEEAREAHPEDLRRIDTFRFEEEKLLVAALDLLDTDDFEQVLAWRAGRSASFWLRRDPRRATEWQIVEELAVLGRALHQAGGELGADSLPEAIDRYVAVGAAVDRAHRVIEQRLVQPLGNLPHLQKVKTRTHVLRESWRAWANAWGRQFNQLCHSRGFLPSEGLLQRSLFEQVVRPMTQEPGVTAYFVVDALRYEMALPLLEAMQGTPATTVALGARLCELPSVTEVGMNVLAPVSPDGRLVPAIRGSKIKGFSAGEFRVHDPATRQKAMHHRVGGETCPWLKLAEVLERDTTTLKLTIARARLIVVHSEQIDQAGEKGLGPSVFEAVLQRLRAAWSRLREAGVRRFVITSDHGFLLLDPAENLVDATAYGRKSDPQRRHVLTPVAADHPGMSRAPLTELGYDLGDAQGGHDQLVFPDNVGPFDTGKHRRTFVHGGNSLQERVIPVLTVAHRTAVGSDSLRYAVHAETLPTEAGVHRLEIRVDVLAQGALAFGGRKEIELGLRAVDAPEVHVDLRDVRGARRTGASIHVAPDTRVELSFALSGPVDRRVQVQVLHVAALAEVEPALLSQRFDVLGRGGPREEPDQAPAPTADDSDAWLADLPEGGIRELFRHLATHGTVTESEATQILGSARKVRRLSSRFDDYAAMAPFPCRIDVVDGVKRYVRDGGTR